MKENKIYATITMKEHGEFHLCEPSFDVLAMAMRRMMSGLSEMEVDMVQSGKIIFDGCYIGNNIALSEIIVNTPLYVNLCMKAFGLVRFFEGELKKN